MEDVRERLAQIKKEHAERMKDEVTSHWSKLTEEGKRERTQEDTRPGKSGQMHTREKSRIMSGERVQKRLPDHSEEEEEKDEEEPRDNPRRPGVSGDVHNRSKNRVVSPENVPRPRGDNRRKPGAGRSDRDGAREDREGRANKPKPDAKSGNVHNRDRNRVRSGEGRR